MKEEGKSLIGKLLPLAHYMSGGGRGFGHQFSMVEEVRIGAKNDLMRAIGVDKLGHLHEGSETRQRNFYWVDFRWTGKIDYHVIRRCCY